MTNKYGRYEADVDLIQTTYKDAPSYFEARRQMHLQLKPYTQWQVADLIAVARSTRPIGGVSGVESDFYNYIFDMYTEVKNNGPHAKEAKEALAAIAPNSCKGNCSAFMNMIKDASDQMDSEDMGPYYNDYIALKGLVKKDWAKPELTEFATNPKTAKSFQLLLGIADGVFNDHRDNAGNALDPLLPKGCTRATFAQLIEIVANENRIKHLPGRIGLIEHSDIKDAAKGFGSIVPQRELNQQTALASLDAHGVKMDASHDLKKPLETAVTDAVKGIKSSITLAA